VWQDPCGLSTVLARDVPAADLWRLASILLTDRQYEAFVLVFGPQELSYREAALVLGVDPTAACGSE
jgi:hypothetical protein